MKKVEMILSDILKYSLIVLTILFVTVVVYNNATKQPEKTLKAEIVK